MDVQFTATASTCCSVGKRQAAARRGQVDGWMEAVIGDASTHTGGRVGGGGGGVVV